MRFIEKLNGQQVQSPSKQSNKTLHRKLDGASSIAGENLPGTQHVQVDFDGVMIKEILNCASQAGRPFANPIDWPSLLGANMLDDRRWIKQVARLLQESRRASQVKHGMQEWPPAKLGRVDFVKDRWSFLVANVCQMGSQTLVYQRSKIRRSVHPRDQDFRYHPTARRIRADAICERRHGSLFLKCPSAIACRVPFLHY